MAVLYEEFYICSELVVLSLGDLVQSLKGIEQMHLNNHLVGRQSL